MKQKKIGAARITAAALASVLLALLLASCGGGGEGKVSNPFGGLFTSEPQNDSQPERDSESGAESSAAISADASSGPEESTRVEFDPKNSIPVTANGVYHVHTEKESETTRYIFTPDKTTAYSLYADSDCRIYFNAVLGDGSERNLFSCSEGPGNFRYSAGDTGGYIPVIEGRTYTAVIQWYGAGDHTFRLESFDHQIETVKKAGAPRLVPGETAHVDFNGELLSGAALFTPAETGLYTVEAGNGAYKFILGEDGVFFDGGRPDDSYVKARLLAGKTYLFYIYNKDKTPASADVKVKLNAEKAFAPVTFNAADAAGTLRYTVIILQDNYVMVREYAEEQEFAKRLCADLIAADGTDYIALVDMYEGNIILWDGYSQYGRDPYPWTDDIFTNDTGKLNTCIGWIDGTVMRNCDVSGALDYAGLLLDAARATYGDKVETNIVLFSASDFKDGARVYPGRYSADDDSNGTWALCDYCNAAYLKAEEVKSKGHKIYSMSVNDRFYASEDMEYPLEERENNFLRRVMKDLSSGEEYYFDIWRGDDIKLAADAVARHITGK